MNFKAWILPVLCILTGIAVWVIFAARTKTAEQNQAAQDKLCLVIYRLEANSVRSLGTPKAPGYAYFQDHPEELKSSKKQGEFFLKQLPCRP